MMNDSASTPSSTEKSSAAYLKRREQVRRAQRTHRARKESYIHALESEILALRTQARNVEQHNEALSLEVAELRRRIRVQSTLPASSTWRGGSIGLGAQEESWMGVPEVPFCETSCPAEVVPFGAGRVSSDSRSWTMSVSHADMAMEFVLTLEKPCVQRAQSVVFDPLNAYPLDHSLEHSELALYHSFVEEEIVVPDQCRRADVAGSLDNLLALSSAFCLENEVTPVQAWQHLSGCLEIGAVDSEGFRALVDALLEHVRCYGDLEKCPRSNLQ